MEIITTVAILTIWLALIIVPLNIGPDRYVSEEASEEVTDTHFMRG